MCKFAISLNGNKDNEKRSKQLAVRQVTFSEAEDLDDQYYASLSEVERLEILMELRSMIDPGVD